MMDASNKIQIEKPSLSRFFRAVDRRLERMFPVKTSYRVRVCGRLIEICLFGKEYVGARDKSMAGFLTQEEGTADATFYYWNDDCQPYLPAGADRSSAVWQSRDETGFLQIATDLNTLVGCDRSRHSFYYCSPPAPGAKVRGGKMLAPLFSLWAEMEDLLLLHAAAVGNDGGGVLIVGKSGSGKSTLSLSCLLDGMEFIGDDYILITASGPLRARPIYTLAAANQDVLDQLPLDKVPSVYVDHLSNGKPQLVLGGGLMCPELPIKAVVLPVVSGEEEPYFQKVDHGGVLTKLIHSSTSQINICRNTQLIRRMSMRLFTLPCYEMHVSPQLMKNPAALRRFIEEEL